MDKVAAANKINEFLQAVVTHGGLRLKYRIIVDPPLPENRDWEKPEILVDFAGPDSALLLDRGGELLRALELLALEMLHLSSGEHEKICFDSQNRRSMRIQELRTAANVAAEKVRRTGTPYHFSPKAKAKAPNDASSFTLRTTRARLAGRHPRPFLEPAGLRNYDSLSEIPLW